LWFFAANSTLFTNSRIDRVLESDLPQITTENERIVYCRMQADDFRFPLPPHGTALDPQISSGGYDTVEGSVRVRYIGGFGMSSAQYEEWLRERLQTGGWVTVKNGEASADLIVSFSYFGDK